MLKKLIPKLRRVSVTSPYADKHTAADNLGRDIVFAWKPNPTPLAMTTVDWEWIEEDMRETFRLARECCLEVVMKSTETFRGDKERLKRWVNLALRLSEEATH